MTFRSQMLQRDRVVGSSYYGPFDPLNIGEDEYIEIDGPAGFNFTFNKYIFEFTPLVRWYSFLKDSTLQQEIREICKELADYFGYNFAIYMGDDYCASDYIFEGRDMKYYKTDLRNRFGDAKTKIVDLLVETSDGWNSEGYYIDNFKDFENNL